MGYDWTRSASEYSFNPCCIGLDNDAGRRRLVPLHQSRVSILVVLDWTMMPSKPSKGHGTRRRFNPCCIGLDNDAISGYRGPVGVDDVSILVVLDWTMMLSVRYRLPAGITVSILVVLDWTMMPCLANPCMVFDDVSILVVLDWTMMPWVGRAWGMQHLEFQSLLYGIGQ